MIRPLHDRATTTWARFGVGKPKAWIHKGKTLAEAVFAENREFDVGLQSLIVPVFGGNKGFRRKGRRFSLIDSGLIFSVLDPRCRK